MFPNKWFIIAPVVAGILYVTWFGILGWPRPFKVTDVTSSKFDPLQFKFEDYYYRGTLDETISFILKDGMTENEVDKILVDSAKAEKRKSSDINPKEIEYCKIPDFYWMRALRSMSDVIGYHVFVTFDADGKSERIVQRIFPQSQCEYKNPSRSGDFLFFYE